MSTPALEHFAKLLAERDHREGDFRHGTWGVAVIAWAAGVVRDHGPCGQLDKAGIDEFKCGVVDAPWVQCPVHGRLAAPEMPR